MQSLRTKQIVKNIFILLAVLFAIVFFAFISNTFSNSTLYAEEQSIGEETPFDREEIKIDNVILHSEKSSAKAGESVKLYFEVKPYYSSETIKEVEYVIVSGKNYASVNSDGILSIYDEAKAYESVAVKVIVNGAISNVVTISIDKTIVEEFTINTESQTIREGGKGSVFVEKLLPLNASFQKIKYEITNGSEYATINSQTGEIKVNDEISKKDAVFTVCAYTCENYDKKSNEITFDIYVPLKNMKLSASQTIAKISSNQGEVIKLNATTEDIVSVFNPTYVIDPKYSQYAHIENNLLYIHKDLKESVVIPVWAQQDGAESNTLYIEVYILTEDIVLNSGENITTVTQFLSYDFSAKTYPSYANSQNLSYSLTDLNGRGVEYATIDQNGLLYVKDEAPSLGALKLEIKNDDMTKTIVLQIQEYNVNNIQILNENLPKILYPNEQVDFVAILDNLYQTQNHFTVQHAFGDEGTFYNCGNYIVIKPLEELEKLGENKLSFTVKLKSTNGIYSAEQQFDVFLPVESMQNQVLNVDRGTDVYVDMIFNSNNFATDKSLMDMTNQIVDGKTITVEKTNIVGQIKIGLPSNLQYNTNIDIPVYTKDGDVTCTISLIINELNLDNFDFILDGEDSEEHVIDDQNPQLYVGRSLTTQITYNNKSILEYGLTVKEQTSENATVEILDDTLSFTAGDVAGGSQILCDVKIKDGSSTKIYNISLNKLSVFNPADTQDAIYIEDVNSTKNTITFNEPTLDLQSYYKYNDVNDSPFTSKWVTAVSAYTNENMVSIINTTPWDGFNLVIHYAQTYNGVEREVGQTTVKASLGFDKSVYQDYKAPGDDLKVTGVGDSTGWFFGTTYSGSDSMELSGGRVSDGFKPIAMEYQKLKESGFSKIQITLELDIAEIRDGYQEVYVLIDNDSDVNNGYIEVFRDGYVEHTPGEKNGDWSTHTFVFEVSIDTLMNNSNIAIACGAHGVSNDTWNWGWTRFTFEAIA